MMRNCLPGVATLVAISFSAGTACSATEQPEIRFVEGQGSEEALDPEQRALAQLAIRTLAEDLGVPADRIRVDTIRAVQWPDSSVGCPQPGQQYLQVVTPGHRISLRVDGQLYTVHEAGGKAFVCHHRKLGSVPLTPELEIVWGEQMLEARADLASRLGVPEDNIRPVGGRPTTWDDSSLGCPEPGGTYAPGPVEGYVLVLRHGMRQFTYHTDMQRTIPCPPITAD